MRNFLIAAAVLASATVANAANLSAVAEDIDGTLTKYTISLNFDSAAGESFVGLDGGVTGDLNQSSFALPTPFTDFNGIDGDSDADTQFLFNTSTDGVLHIGTQESASGISSAISNIAPLDLASPAAFLQVVSSADPADLAYDFAFDLGTGAAVPFAGDIGGLLIPEPTTAVLAGLAVVGFAARRK